MKMISYGDHLWFLDKVEDGIVFLHRFDSNNEKVFTTVYQREVASQL